MESKDSKPKNKPGLLFNMIKFTIKAENNKDRMHISNALDYFILRSGLILNRKTPEDAMLKRTRYRLEKDFCDLLTIKVTKAGDGIYYYTITIKNISNHYELEDISEDAHPVAQEQYENFKSKYCDLSIINRRVKIATIFILMLKENYLYNDATIKEVGFVRYYHVGKDKDPKVISLLETHKNKKNGVFYHQHKLDVNRTIYTKQPKYYKAFIKVTKSIQENIHGTSDPEYADKKKNSYLVRLVNKCKITNSKDEENLLRRYFNKYLSQYEDRKTYIDSANRIYIKIDAKSINKYGLPTDKSRLKFIPDFENKVSHGSITFDTKEVDSFKYDYLTEGDEIKFKSRIVVKLFVKNFVSRDKEYIEYYEGEDKINFKLGYEYDHIVSVISRFLKDFHILLDKQDEFKNLDKNLSVNKLFKGMDNSSIVSIPLGERIGTLLNKFIGKKEKNIN